MLYVNTTFANRLEGAYLCKILYEDWIAEAVGCFRLGDWKKRQKIAKSTFLVLIRSLARAMGDMFCLIGSGLVNQN